MNRYIIGSLWDRDNRNGTNKNFEYLFEGRRKIDELNVRADNILNEAKKTNDMNEDVQEQINTLVAESGTSDAEILQARVDSDGNAYSVLKERLDVENEFIHQEISKSDLEIKRVNQKNFSDYQDRSSIAQYGNTYSVLSDRQFIFKIGLGGGETVDYYFSKNSLDDLMKFRTVTLNALTESSTRKDYLDANVGVWSMSSSTSSQPFASVPDTTITHTFDGNKLYFHHFTDDRGGVWEFKIDGQLITNLSTHVNAVSESEKMDSTIARRLIADDLTSGSHTILMTFIGDDPNNPPSSGVGTSRGWTRRNTGSSNNPDLNVETFEFITSSNKKIEVLSDSNKPFAFSAKERGTSHTTQWFPEHNSIGTAFVGNSGYQEIFVDGSPISISSPVNEKSFEEVKIVQKLEFIHPNSTSPLGVLVMTTTVNKKGAYFASKMTWLKNVDIAVGYVNMLTLNTAFADTLISSMGGKYDVTKTDGSDENINEPLPFGFVATSNSYPDYAVYMQSFSPSDLRVGEESTAGDVSGNGFYFLQHRNDRLQKLYPHVYDKHYAKAGEIYEYEVQYGFIKNPNIVDLLN